MPLIAKSRDNNLHGIVRVQANKSDSFGITSCSNTQFISENVLQPLMLSGSKMLIEN